MNSDFLHGLLVSLDPIGRNFFFLSLLITVGSICFDWIQHKPNTTQKHIPGRKYFKKIILGLTIITIVGISMLPALICWSKADKNYFYTIGGLIPWSDGNREYSSAEYLIETGKLDPPSHRRPLNSALFAFRLAVTGNNIQFALLIQGILFGLACFSASYSVRKTISISASLLFFSICFIYASTCLPTALTECLGITIGLLAFSLLWYGVSKERQSAFYAGLVVLTLALLGRAGPMLVLPAFVLYTGYVFRKGKKYNWCAMGMAGICILLGFLINTGLVWFYGDGSGMVLGNFSHTLYGLSVGGKGWKQIYSDYPQAIFLPEGEMSRFIYSKAWENILGNPFVLLKTYCLGLFKMPFMLAGHLARLLVFQNDGNSPYNLSQVTIGGLCLFPFFLMGLFRFIRKYLGHRLLQFLAVFWGSFVLSLPIIYKDGAMRTIAAIFPFIAVTFALAAIGWRRTRLSIEESEKDDRQEKILCFWFPTCFGFILVIIALFGPWFFSDRPGKPQSYSEFYCPSDQQALIMRIGPGLPYLEIENSTRNSFAPLVNAKDFSILDRNEAAPIWRKVVPPTSILLAYDRRTKQAQFLVAPPGFVRKQWQEMFICAQDERLDPYNKIFRLKSSLSLKSK